MPAEPCLLFYWFEIETDQGLAFYSLDHLDSFGSGVRVDQRPTISPDEHHPPLPWQVTVYSADFTVPEWMPGAVFYQIFPDRFNRDSGFSLERFKTNDRPDRIWHDGWDEDVDYIGKPETGYLACDFFGGTLAGICEKLDYLKDLGVGVLSLNPIFKARSNHRYDTGDYERIDPLLGDEAAFKVLCSEAGSRGIRIILDGVFSHTGADSRYFNRYGHYPEPGAWQEATGQALSRFGSWYTFHHKGDQVFYDSWWGFQELPAVNENDLSYQSYMTGPDGIVRKWLDLGASGWRLDVSDELPDLFLRSLRKTVRDDKPDAVLLGEVWEDATCKVSYGTFRDFLLGDTHDTVMGYPFQEALIGWLSGRDPAQTLMTRLERIREHYPRESFYSSYNLISGHDIPRAITALAGQPDPGSRAAQAKTFLSTEQRDKGRKLLRLALAFQMTFPGCPVIYYGDETAMEGYRDPFNRRPFPWGREDRAMQSCFAGFASIRNSLPVFKTGHFSFVHARNDMIAFRRFFKSGQDVFGQAKQPVQALVAINRSSQPGTIEIGSESYELPGFGVLVEVDGQMIDLPKL